MRPWRLLVLILAAGGAVAGGYLWQRRVTREAGLEQLERRRDALRQRLAALRAPGDLLTTAPRASVALGMPSDYAAEVVRAVTTRLLDRVVLNLGGIRVRKQGDVRTKLLFARVKAGTWHLDLTIDRIRAVLRPGDPQMDFGGGSDRVAVEFPVNVEQGEGHARLRFRWDSAGVANLACRNFEVEQAVSGRVVPSQYHLRGSFLVTADGDAMAVLPEFRERTIRVRVQPSARTWRGVRGALDAQDSFWRCGVALEPAEIEQKLRELIDRGFDVTLPDSLFRPIRLPASVHGSVQVSGREVALRVTPQALSLTRQMLWYGAAVEAEVQEPSAP